MRIAIALPPPPLCRLWLCTHTGCQPVLYTLGSARLPPKHIYPAYDEIERVFGRCSRVVWRDVPFNCGGLSDVIGLQSTFACPLQSSSVDPPLPSLKHVQAHELRRKSRFIAPFVGRQNPNYDAVLPLCEAPLSVT